MLYPLLGKRVLSSHAIVASHPIPPGYVAGRRNNDGVSRLDLELVRDDLEYLINRLEDQVKRLKNDLESVRLESARRESSQDG